LATSIITTPGVIRILGTPAGPIPIDDAEIEALQRTVASALPVEPWPYGVRGQRVRVERGPLAGVEGTVVTMKPKDRIVVSVDLVCRSVAVEIEAHWMDPIRLPYHELPIAV
jgi:transcription antitermination factor NusG